MSKIILTDKESWKDKNDSSRRDSTVAKHVAMYTIQQSCYEGYEDCDDHPGKKLTVVLGIQIIQTEI